MTATAACVLGLAACSGSSHPSAVPSASAPGHSPEGIAAPAAARAALGRVVAATRRIHSYAFQATQDAGGSSTRITGRAIRPRALTYTLSSGGHTEQVVRVDGVSYRRVLPGGYRELTRPAPAVDPLASLITVLQRLSAVTEQAQPAGTTFTGTLDGAGASAAGLVGKAHPVPGIVVPVVIITDVHGRVTRVTATVPLRVRTKPVPVKLVTAFAGFDVQPPIRAPRR